jgi:amidase
MGKTVTTEFAYRTAGKTRNPWNPAHTPGGSSSGSAAAVAAGFVPVAIGTQTLGSVIRPAAFCGVVGYKPSYGAISRTGIHPFSATLDTVGVFARSVADAAWFGACLMGLDARDEATSVKGATRTLPFRWNRSLRRHGSRSCAPPNGRSRPKPSGIISTNASRR